MENKSKRKSRKIEVKKWNLDDQNTTYMSNDLAGFYSTIKNKPIGQGNIPKKPVL